MKQTDHRFHIGCKMCGFVGSLPRRWHAEQHAINHYHGVETSVFDTMAKPGALELQRFNGDFLRHEMRPRS